jgi:hypothetical protein
MFNANKTRLLHFATPRPVMTASTDAQNKATEANIEKKEGSLPTTTH